jgi:hypothetical protein
MVDTYTDPAALQAAIAEAQAAVTAAEASRPYRCSNRK